MLVLLAESFLERNGTAFQILATAIALALSGLGGWWLRSRSKKFKTLDFRVLSDLAILSHRPDDAELKVTYLDEELDNPRLVRVRLKNTGTEVIRDADVLEPIVLTINAQVAGMSVAEQSGRIIEVFALTIEDFPKCRAELPIATMNPGDFVTFQMIVDSDESPKFAVTGRIEGQTRPPGDERLKDARAVATGSMLGGLSSALILAGVAIMMFLAIGGGTQGSLVLIPLVAGASFGIYSVVRSLRNLRRAPRSESN